ncbi:MAG: hypothetical protein ACLQAH_13685 [Limisphaerales bacterium]
MSIFNLHSTVIGEYRDFVRSFFPGETFRVLKEKETAKFGEYRTRRLVPEVLDRLG